MSSIKIINTKNNISHITITPIPKKGDIVAKIAALFYSIIVIGTLGLGKILLDPIAHKICGKHYNHVRSFQENFAKQGIEKLKEKIQELDDDASCAQLKKYIENASLEKNTISTYLAIRQKLSHLAKEQLENTNFQELATVIRENEAQSLLKEFTKNLQLPEKITETNSSFLIDQLETMRQKLYGFHHDHWIFALFHRLCFVSKGIFASLKAEFSPFKWNSYVDDGNLDMKLSSLSLNNQKVEHYLGPTPVCDNLFALHRKAHKEKVHVQHNLQKPNGVEGERTKAIHEMRNYSTHTYTTPMDGEAWNLKGRFSSYQKNFQIKEFIQKYKEYAIEGNGFDIPNTTLPKEELEKAFDTIQGLFENYSLQTSSKEQTIIVARAIQLAIQGLITLKVLKHTNAQSFGAACKQGIDRGLVHNLLLRINHLIIQDDYSEEAIQEVLGMFLRPLFTAHRGPLLSRYQPLFVLLELIKNIPSYSDKIKEALEA